MSINKIGFILVALLLGVGMMAAQEQSEKTMKTRSHQGNVACVRQRHVRCLLRSCHGTDGKVSGQGLALSRFLLPTYLRLARITVASILL